MNMKTVTLPQLEQQLTQELNDRAEEIKRHKCPDDLLTEIVDGCVPIYHADLLECALHDLWLGVVEPEIYAFDGKHTAVNAIAGNIYEHLQDLAFQWLAEQNKAE